MTQSLALIHWALFTTTWVDGYISSKDVGENADKEVKKSATSDTYWGDDWEEVDQNEKIEESMIYENRQEKLDGDEGDQGKDSVEDKNQEQWSVERQTNINSAAA